MVPLEHGLCEEGIHHVGLGSSPPLGVRRVLVLSAWRRCGCGLKDLALGEYTPALAPWKQEASCCEPVSSLPLPGLTGFLNFDHRAEFQRLSEENLVLKSDLGRIQLELETSESRNETQR